MLIINNVVLMGRLTKDPDVRYTQGGIGIARYTLAVDRRFKKEGEPDADFIGCVAFGKQAEFAEKYFHHGIKIAITGRIQTGSYTNKDGQKVYTTDVVVENQEFAESKKQSEVSEEVVRQDPPADGKFHPVIDVPEGISEELPFV